MTHRAAWLGALLGVALAGCSAYSAGPSTLAPAVERAATETIYAIDRTLPPGSIVAYSTSGKALRQIKNGLVQTLAVDGSGNLYTGGGDDAAPVVYEYAPYAVTPSRTLTFGVAPNSPMVADPAGNLYVLDSFGGSTTPVLVKFGSSGTTALAHTFLGITTPMELAIDAPSQTLLVANHFPNRIGEYTTAKLTLARSIAPKQWTLERIAVDEAGTLYAQGKANAAGSAPVMFEFARGKITANAGGKLAKKYGAMATCPGKPGVYMASFTAIDYFPPKALAPAVTLPIPYRSFVSQIVCDGQGNLYAILGLYGGGNAIAMSIGAHAPFKTVVGNRSIAAIAVYP